MLPLCEDPSFPFRIPADRLLPWIISVVQFVRNRRNSSKEKSLRNIAGSRENGGGENRTRVPWHFSVGLYVCSLSFFDGQNLAIPPPRSPRRSPASRVPLRLTGREFSRCRLRCAGPERPCSGNSEPELATKPKPLRRRSRTWGYR